MFWFRKRIRRRRRRRTEASSGIFWQVLYGIVAIVVVVMLCVLVWFGTRHDSLVVSQVVVTGGETIDHQGVETIVEDLLRGSYLFLVPRRFVYTIPKEEIIAAIEAIPRVHNVRVARDGTTLRVSFSEYVPDALWCVDGSNASECYFLDKTGYAFSIAPALRGGALLRHVVEESGELAEKQVLEPEVIERTKELARLLNERFGYRVSQVFHSVVGDVTYTIHGASELKTAMSMPVPEIIDNLASILESEEFSHLAPGNFEYIDLRFGKKVFVKEVVEEPEDENEEQEEQTEALVPAETDESAVEE